VGQEVVIRVLHRGGGRVARRLVGLRITGAAPARGARVFATASAGARDVGFITSSAVSPRRGSIALAYVHRDFTARETPLEVGDEAGRVPAAVTPLPMP
jgi:glycine cleavage system aminomethyltransferase T